MKVTKRVLEDDGQTTRQDDETLTIHIKPGYKAGMRGKDETGGGRALRVHGCAGADDCCHRLRLTLFAPVSSLLLFPLFVGTMR